MPKSWNLTVTGLMVVALLIGLFPIFSDAQLSQVAARVSKKNLNKTQKKRIISLTKSIKKRWDMQRLSKSKLPTGWKSLSGNWEVVSEPEYPSNKVLRQKMLKREEQLLITQADYANFDFSVRLRADSFERKTRNWQMGILFRKVDDYHFYKLRITAGNIALIRYSLKNKEIIPGSSGSGKVAGTTGKLPKSGEQVLLILPIGSISDKWHTLKVQCYGERITIKLNDREVRSVNDVGIGAGKLGVFTYKTQAFIDDLKLTYLPVPKKINGILPVKKHYYPKKEGALLIYFNLKQSGRIDLSAFDSQKKLFAVITKNYYTAGINSVVWNGQSVLGKQLRPGRYTLKLQTEKATQQSNITIH